MKARLLLFILLIISITIPSASFAQKPINCHFGDESTSLDEIFEKDLAVVEFTQKHQNATRYVAIDEENPSTGELSFTIENKNETQVLLIKFHQNENGCYRPSSYHYSYDNGIIDVTIRNSLSDFTEIINLIKSDDKKIEDFYTKNCNPIRLDFVLAGESEPYFCKSDYNNSIEMVLQKHLGGIVEVHIPNKTMNALFYNCQVNDGFIVLNNGEEILYELIVDEDKRIFKVDLPQGYSKTEIIGFTNLGNNEFCGSIWSDSSRYISPLLQTKIGIDPWKVQCNDDLVLIFKTTDNSLACVKPETKIKLLDRGWAFS